MENSNETGDQKLKSLTIFGMKSLKKQNFRVLPLLQNCSQLKPDW
jgi:hypothetical protein